MIAQPLAHFDTGANRRSIGEGQAQQDYPWFLRGPADDRPARNRPVLNHLGPDFVSRLFPGQNLDNATTPPAEPTVPSQEPPAGPIPPVENVKGEPQKLTGEPVEKTAGDSLLPVEKLTGGTVGNSGGKVGGNSEFEGVGNPSAQQVTGKYPQFARKTEWFRHELDFRKSKVGYKVMVRKRLRWSEARFSDQKFACKCPDLTAKMVSDARAGRLTKPAIEALKKGGMSNEVIKQLVERIGKGRGKRRTELEQHERLILDRIERRLATSRGSRDDSAGTDGRRDANFSRQDVRETSNGDDSGMPWVH